MRSLGNHVCNYFTADSRYGPPSDLMLLIDRCHAAGVGVILDWNPSHFPRDVHGLVMYDGTQLYNSDESESTSQRDWELLSFDYGRPEVQSFLVSNALLWLEAYHADGLRVNSVSSVIYQGYGENSEGLALGVAILAGVGAGVYESIPVACREILKFHEAQKPSEESKGAYAPYYALYQELYRSVKAQFQTLASL